jgi:hypothetical protein
VPPAWALYISIAAAALNTSTSLDMFIVTTGAVQSGIEDARLWPRSHAATFGPHSGPARKKLAQSCHYRLTLLSYRLIFFWNDSFHALERPHQAPAQVA